MLRKLKKELKILLHSSHTIALSKGTIFAKNCWFFAKKYADISKINGFLVLKGKFCKTKYVSVFEIFSIIVFSTVGVGNFPPNPVPPTTKRTPKKPTQIRVNLFSGVLNMPRALNIAELQNVVNMPKYALLKYEKYFAYGLFTVIFLFLIF